MWPPPVASRPLSGCARAHLGWGSGFSAVPLTQEAVCILLTALTFGAARFSSWIALNIQAERLHCSFLLSSTIHTADFSRLFSTGWRRGTLMLWPPTRPFRLLAAFGYSSLWVVVYPDIDLCSFYINMVSLKTIIQWFSNFLYKQLWSFCDS